MKYFVYTRKSTESDERQALSIPAQVRELKEFAVDKDLEIYEIFEESKSASKPNNRPEFTQMIERIKAKECQRILCWHTNRLSRNPMESGIIMQMLSDGQLLEILTPQKSITYENANDILLGVEFGANSQFSRDLSYNTKRGLREKVLRGEWPTYAPPFYINVGRKKGEKNIAPNPNNYEYYERLIDEIINHRIPAEHAHKILKDWGVKSKRGNPLSRNAVIRLLRNPVYYGWFEYKGMEPRKGAWKPLVRKEKWDKLQKVLDDKSKPTQSKHNLPFRKQIVCAKCGYTVVPYRKIKPSGKVYTYYGCSKRGGNCSNSPITQKDLEQQIIEHIQKIKLDEETLNTLKTMAKEKLGEELKYEFNKRDDYEKEYQEVSEHLSELLSLRVGKEINAEEYQEAKEPLVVRKEELEELKDAVKFNKEDIYKQLELFFENCFNLEELFINGTFEEKSQLVHTISENLTLNDKKLGWNFKEPWSHMVSIDIDDENFEWGALVDTIMNLDRKTIESIRYALRYFKDCIPSISFDIV